MKRQGQPNSGVVSDVGSSLYSLPGRCQASVLLLPFPSSPFSDNCFAHLIRSPRMALTLTFDSTTHETWHYLFFSFPLLGGLYFKMFFLLITPSINNLLGRNSFSQGCL